MFTNQKKGDHMFSKELGEKLDKFHLLKHPFYQVYWNEGKLTREIIRDYANSTINTSKHFQDTLVLLIQFVKI